MTRADRPEHPPVPGGGLLVKDLKLVDRFDRLVDSIGHDQRPRETRSQPDFVGRQLDGALEIGQGELRLRQLAHIGLCADPERVEIIGLGAEQFSRGLDRVGPVHGEHRRTRQLERRETCPVGILPRAPQAPDGHSPSPGPRQRDPVSVVHLGRIGVRDQQTPQRLQRLLEPTRRLQRPRLRHRVLVGAAQADQPDQSDSE